MLYLRSQVQPYNSTRIHTVRGCSLYGIKRTLLATNGNSNRCFTTRQVFLLPVSTCNTSQTHVKLAAFNVNVAKHTSVTNAGDYSRSITNKYQCVHTLLQNSASCLAYKNIASTQKILTEVSCFLFCITTMRQEIIGCRTRV